MANTKEFLFTYCTVQRLGALVVPIDVKLIAQVKKESAE
ncbi:hypothetical protein GLW07_10910 [Bacillus hwajinpoensis]|uniref:Uncharacterized protein n=1 Tax=Guptibacillus hwajinpoensis TaxID=208199 RepID=A0A845EZE9_9BACL|nr:hypothetical protein [Pseudalkalibacillus hwajinpoensis]